MKKYLLAATAIVGFAFNTTAQNTGNLSGNLMLNGNFFQRDTAIGAAGNPLYDNLLSGGESWLSLRYSGFHGFDAFLRVDALHNSNLKNPTQPLSGFGIGAWSLGRQAGKMHILGGYIYDQIGSGILFRAYEDRGLLLDNALVGVRLKYDITPEWTVKAFTGQQKNLFSRHEPIIKAINIEGGLAIGENTFISPGIGLLNRTLDRTAIDETLTRINALPASERFSPKYNVYAATLYNTLSYKDVSWYIEGAVKSQEAINDLSGKIVNEKGNVLFSTLNYATKGLALTLTGKRTENFAMRTAPSQTLLNGMMSWQPIIAQIRPQRTIARYSPASQDLSEIGGSANLLYSPSFDYDFNVSYTHINTLDDLKLYREIYASASIRSVKKWLLDFGVQYLEYNQEFYQLKPGAGILKAITPFTEITYRINNTQSLKFQGQYMSTKQDYGSWIYVGLEYAVAPNWSFAINDMYNFDPAQVGATPQHYYNVFTSYTKGANRFTLAYVKQVEGVNCTGGVCRYEPAFSGLRLGITSSF